MTNPKLPFQLSLLKHLQLNLRYGNTLTAIPGMKKRNCWIFLSQYCLRGHVVVQLVEHCATSRKVAGSIPDGVTGIFI